MTSNFSSLLFFKFRFNDNHRIYTHRRERDQAFEKKNGNFTVVSVPDRILAHSSCNELYAYHFTPIDDTRTNIIFQRE